MSEITITGIPVSFPFEPYDVQTAYMEKVIECLQNGTNAVLESPTGTGKTLCLLCSSLAWLLVKKAQMQINAQAGIFGETGPYMKSLQGSLQATTGKQGAKDASWGMPKIIYASRTHSQLTQAMQELKRSQYRHVKAAVLGSRDQLCIHPEVSKETNNVNKVNLCQAKVKSRTCYFYNNVESKKTDPSIKGDQILDIEDLVKVGNKLKCCPYYLAKELKQEADIVFMPYNYLLDPKSRKANGVELLNNVIILDEAHNIERICEDSASLQIKTTEIALCIEEITHLMRSMCETGEDAIEATVDNSQPKDFTSDDLCILKEMMLSFEKAVDEVNVTCTEGTTFPGSFIFDLLAKAEIHDGNQSTVRGVVDNLVQYLSTANGASPFQRKGTGLQKLSDLLHIVFSGTTPQHKQRVQFCYKVHISVEDKKSNKKADGWSALKAPSKSSEKVISYWCFSPGFGMKQLLEQSVRSIILTSGTLAPLRPLISELGIPIDVKLENPHIVGGNQICVKIIGQGPDSFTLNSNYENRNNPKYISSLGRTILSFCRVVPDGLLVFFPSYPIMAKCQEQWQNEGIWSSICSIKPIFVEPQRKDTFNAVMNDYYSRINETSSRGACFMAVCRGKVSEGLDFADMNGRAVIITGLPFPPLKDPRIILKKKYLEDLRKQDKEFLSGDEWYSLEASRAVNQAIGRVIRHKNDYGAILLCDTRFNNPKLKGQLSAWLKGHITVTNKFGEAVGEVCRFFKAAEKTLPSPKLKPLIQDESKDYQYSSSLLGQPGSAFPSSSTRLIAKSKSSQKESHSYPNSNEVYADFSMDFYKNSKKSNYFNDFRPATKDLFTALDENDMSQTNNAKSLVTIHKRTQLDDTSCESINKRKKLKIKPFGFENNINSNNNLTNSSITEVNKSIPESLIDFVKLIKTTLEKEKYKDFQTAISNYKSSSNYEEFLRCLDDIFIRNKDFHYLYKGMKRFLKPEHKKMFDSECSKLGV